MGFTGVALFAAKKSWAVTVAAAVAAVAAAVLLRSTLVFCSVFFSNLVLVTVAEASWDGPVWRRQVAKGPQVPGPCLTRGSLGKV